MHIDDRENSRRVQPEITKQPLLTIAIPTYNRVHCLERALQHILLYMQDYPVEILVSDNASTDGTEAFMLEYVQQHPQVRYYRKGTNTGFGGNFINCMNLARGKYLLLHSDDDILLPEGLKAILVALKENPVFVYLNSVGIDTVPKKLEALMSDEMCTEEDFLTFTDKNAFLAHTGIMLTFISALVFRVEYIHQIADREALIQHNLAQTNIVFRTMQHAGKYIIVRKPCIAASPNLKLRYDLYRTWVYEYAQLLLQEAPACGFDASLCEQILHDDFSRTVLHFFFSLAPASELEPTWDKTCVLPTMARFPDLLPIYKLLIESPVSTWQALEPRVAAMKEERLISDCKEHEKIYVYGAGAIGKYITDVMCKSYVPVEAIVVTQSNDEMQEYRGIPIRTLNQMLSTLRETDDCFIIMAMKREYQMEVQDTLIAQGVHADKIYRQFVR